MANRKPSRKLNDNAVFVKLVARKLTETSIASSMCYLCGVPAGQSTDDGVSSGHGRTLWIFDRPNGESLNVHWNVYHARESHLNVVLVVPVDFCLGVLSILWHTL